MSRGTWLAIGTMLVTTAIVAACSSLDGLASNATDDGGGDGASESAAPADDGGNDERAVDASDGSYAARIIADKPIGYWRFEETSGTTAFDSSGNGHHGSYGANVVLGRPALAGDGNAMELDGSPDAGAQHFVLVPPHSDLRPSTAITVECWLQISGNANANIVSYGTDEVAPFEPYVLFLSDGVPSAYVVANGTGVVVTAPGKISVGQKHHLVAVYDSFSLRLYVDGAEVAAKAASGGISSYDMTNGLGIGSGASATRSIFGGIMDEVAVYRSALSAATISDHHVAGRSN